MSYYNRFAMSFFRIQILFSCAMFKFLPYQLIMFFVLLVVRTDGYYSSYLISQRYLSSTADASLQTNNPSEIHLTFYTYRLSSRIGFTDAHARTHTPTCTHIHTHVSTHHHTLFIPAHNIQYAYMSSKR